MLDDLGAKTTLPNSGVWLEDFPLRKLPPNWGEPPSYHDGGASIQNGYLARRDLLD
jgi:hypothetical protein